MMVVIGLRRIEDRLARLDVGQACGEALGAAAAILDTKIVEVLSQPPGQDHSVPWLRTGELRASINHDVDGTTAVIGSSSQVAVDQELGTRTVPPRPFLAPTAAGAAEELVATVASALARRLADT
jgi:hypothetical protein